MANKAEAKTVSKGELKKYRVLSNVLGEPNEGEATRLHPFRLFRAGAEISLSAKDAKDLLALKVIEPVKTDKAAEATKETK